MAFLPVCYEDAFFLLGLEDALAQVAGFLATWLLGFQDPDEPPKQ